MAFHLQKAFTFNYVTSLLSKIIKNCAYKNYMIGAFDDILKCFLFEESEMQTDISDYF